MDCPKCSKKMAVKVEDVFNASSRGLAIIVKFKIIYSCSDCGRYEDVYKYLAIQLDDQK